MWRDSVITVKLDERQVVERLADATGLEFEEVWEHLNLYLRATASQTLKEMLTYDEQTQHSFVSFVLNEREKSKTAPVGGAVS